MESKSPIDIILSVNPFGAVMIYPPQVYPKGGYTHHRYISSIWRHTDGGLEIHGSAGTRRYIGYSKREAVTRYNQEARGRA